MCLVYWQTDTSQEEIILNKALFIYLLELATLTTAVKLDLIYLIVYHLVKDGSLKGQKSQIVSDQDKNWLSLLLDSINIHNSASVFQCYHDHKMQICIFVCVSFMLNVLTLCSPIRLGLWVKFSSFPFCTLKNISTAAQWKAIYGLSRQTRTKPEVLSEIDVGGGSDSDREEEIRCS